MSTNETTSLPSTKEMPGEEFMAKFMPRVLVREMIRKDAGDEVADGWYNEEHG